MAANIITVDATKGDPNKPGYGFLYTDQTKTPAHNLYVSASGSDTIQWKVAALNGTPGQTRIVISFPAASPFASPSGTSSILALEGTDTNATSALSVRKGDATYEYHVAVFDEVNNKIFTDDPKIIVGTGDGIQQLLKGEERLQTQIDCLQGQIAEITGLLKKLKAGQGRAR